MKKAKKVAGPAVIVAVVARDGEYTETVRVDNIRPVTGETSDASNARKNRFGWARKSVSEWSTLGPDRVFSVAWSDGTSVAATLAEVTAVVAEIYKGASENPPPVAHDAATCGCDRCVSARDASRGVPVAPVASAKPRATRKEKAPEVVRAPTIVTTIDAETGHKIGERIESGEGSPVTPIASAKPARAKRKASPPPATVPAESTAMVHVASSAVTATADDIIPPGGQRGEPIVFTFGYAGPGTTAAKFGAIMKELRIATVIDTRIESTTRAHGWSEKALRAALGSAYVVAMGRGAVIEAVKAANAAGNIMLLRREEAPGDSAYALELAKLIPCVHAWRNEYVASHALQAAIDADIATGGDHEYPCIADDGQDDAATAERASA